MLVDVLQRAIDDEMKLPVDINGQSDVVGVRVPKRSRLIRP